MSASVATGASGARPAKPMPWTSIIRLGLVQAALGSVVVLVISSLNRVMVVEYSLPAIVPGLLIALHYAVQIIRTRFGYGSDRGGRRTPWIVGGMAILATGGVLCAVATAGLAHQVFLSLALAVVAYSLVGLGVGAAGTSLLVLLASRVDDAKRAAAATLMWVLMIASFAITSAVVGHFLDPFSPQRLIMVCSIAALCAFAIATAAIWNVEDGGEDRAEDPLGGTRGRHAGTVSGEVSFSAALRRIASEPETRRFTLFVFVSMLAYSAQELLLEPFAGLVFHYSLGASARLSGLWHAAALVGMLSVGVACSGRRSGSLRGWTIGGCGASAVALLSLAFAGLMGPGWPVRISVIALGVANGVFAVAAIGSMMLRAHQGNPGRAGIRMGLWGATQAIGFALGGIAATGILDLARLFFGTPEIAFAIVFGTEAALFLTAAWCAALGATRVPQPSMTHATALTE